VNDEIMRMDREKEKRKIRKGNVKRKSEPLSLKIKS